MLLIQVILGGITRLTGSGLSITEWNVVTGILPPFTDTQWTAEFAKYQQTPQYQLLNSDFQISDFKFIFFWEWLHRAWARLIAIVFLIPFIYFLLKSAITSKMIKPLVILFLLGALQGAVGWIMVASGLTGDAVYVKPIKLAVHFVLALGLISYAFWFSLSIAIPRTKLGYTQPAYAIWLILGLIFLQLLFGALMAGFKAAPAAPTWPLINGEFVPGRVLSNSSFAKFFEDLIAIHFIHRSLAYLIFVATLIWTIRIFKSSRAESLFRMTCFVPMLLVIVQVILGITAVILSPSIVPQRWGAFEWLALFHQIVGMLFLLSMILMLYLSTTMKSQVSALSLT